MSHFVSFPDVRIKQYDQGYAVEIKEYYGFLKRKYKWKHIISVSGLEKEPWYYCSYELALTEAVKFFKWDLILNTNIKKDEF